MAAGTISGKRIHCKINGVLVSGLHEWTWTGEGDELDGTTGEDLGWNHPHVGVQSGTAELTIIYYVGVSSFAQIADGSLVTNLRLYLTETETTPAVYLPFGVVMRATRTGSVRGRLEIRATVRSIGPPTYGDPAS